MTDYGRDIEQIDEDIAYAVGEGLDILEYIRQQQRARFGDD